MQGSQVPVGYKLTGVGVIPEDWELKSLGDIGKFKNGINKGAEDFGFGSPFVNLMDVFGVNSISTSEHLGLINSNDIEKKIYDLKKGDVIFVRSSVKPSGVGLTTVVVEDLPNVVYSGFLIRFRSNSSLDVDFKRFCFSEEKFRRSVIANSTISANTNINQENLKKLYLIFPKSDIEQQAIALVLSDTDALITSLDKLIAKKRDIKQAAMQQLLTGKQRLEGFSGEWAIKQLRDVLKVRHGKSQHNVIASDGKYPILATGGEIGRTNAYLYNKPSVLIGRKGTIDSPQYIDSPFWTIDTLFFTEIFDSAFPKFIYYKFNMINWRGHNEASGVPSLNASTIESIEFNCPKIEEQQAIAKVLSDMDSEISALEQRRDKTKALKQAMMQELLTGRIRLR